ncbi:MULTISPECIES: RluA family pseudouridine synthase [Bacillaceae]|uniref:RluA family pseudouridine synthase n=1 Tax=Bacillaceae TaxID=186817 RepID=UPI001E416BD6|nr:MULTISPECIES: RluA family pseudouridine synthase [Bacillaceae]MCE4051111.1 RluA family pseudouridine synthase [Bacillus sp. Au-Bac7]MDL0436835.1 RluA family pseudouridine synthase [Niallia sp. SS-2023]UPO88254.1 RluA family pseudouridine synthase [Niallia sp. Man26]
MHFERKGEWMQLAIPAKWKNMSLEDLFRTVMLASKKQVHLFKMQKKVMLNNKIITNWLTTLTTGDTLSIKMFDSQSANIEPTYMELNIVYEDDFLLIINKPAEIDTHPNSLEDVSSLTNGAAFHLLMNGEERQLKHIHRLDRNTTGCILFAKHELIGNMLDYALRERKIKRTYLALVHGYVKGKKGKIDKPIGKDRHHATRRRISENGQAAVTNYRKLAYFPEKDLSLVSCSLDTGRTHQIRVHLSSIGHPLAGDILYGGTPVYSRQALHAARLELTHPITGESLTVYAPFLDDPPVFPENALTLLGE